jgi:hypothetical protein
MIVVRFHGIYMHTYVSVKQVFDLHVQLFVSVSANTKKMEQMRMHLWQYALILWQ